LSGKWRPRRLAETGEQALKPLRRGRCLGSEQFRQQMLELRDEKGNHPGEPHREAAALFFLARGTPCT
jgi:hypothetical protein